MDCRRFFGMAAVLLATVAASSGQHNSDTIAQVPHGRLALVNTTKNVVAFQYSDGQGKPENITLAPGEEIDRTCAGFYQLTIKTEGTVLERSLECGVLYKIVYDIKTKAYDVAEYGRERDDTRGA